MNTVLTRILCGVLVCAPFAGCVSTTKRADKAPESCRVHNRPLESRDGFTIGDGIYADPSRDYVRFMALERYPNVTPWRFSSKRSDLRSVPSTVRYCPQCDADFEEGFEKFRRLSEERKKVLFEAALRKQIERNKAPQ